MKKIVLTMMMASVITGAYAQDTYESARLLGNDLNGTARYVGMGGALEALGADISTTSTNPAAVGMFRHSIISGSIGVVSQQEANTYDGLSKTNFSFDQLGFVYSMQTNSTSFLNLSFNYHKSRNFDQILSAANSLRGSSINKMVYMKDGLNSDQQGGYCLDENNDGDVIGWEDATSDYRALTFSQVDYLTVNTLMQDPNDPDPKPFYYYDGNQFAFDRAHRGWISDFDINVSGNINNRIYLGATLGIHSVNYNGFSQYTEQLVNVKNENIGTVEIADERKITGSGVDLKLGAIFRPLEESPFRLGVFLSTPTWYDLETKNHTEIYNRTSEGTHSRGRNADGYDSYEFKFYTPWKFGLSLGHTIGNYLALGATYEYTDNSAADIRELTGTYDEYDNKNSESDKAMNANVEKTLKGVSTVKLGLEFKPDPMLAVRFGYNYVSPMYNKNGMRDMQINSYGVMYSSTTDYTNWKDTHRITCGLGYKTGNVNIDLAYQYSVTNGDFYPFQSTIDHLDGNYNLTTTYNYSTPTSVNFKRHQVLLTVGCTF